MVRGIPLCKSHICMGLFNAFLAIVMFSMGQPSSAACSAAEVFCFSELGLPTRQLGYLLIAGTVLGRHQDISTLLWACTLCFWGPLLLQESLLFSLCPQGSLCAVEAVYQHKKTYTLYSTFTCRAC